MTAGTARYLFAGIAIVGAVAAAVGTLGGPAWLVFVGVPLLVVFAVLGAIAAQRQRRARWHGVRPTPRR